MTEWQEVEANAAPRSFPGQRWPTFKSRLAALKRRLFRRLPTRKKHLTSADPLGNFEWNELPGDQGDFLNGILVSLLAFGPDGEVCALGSGFIISVDEQAAVGVTAAHVLWDAAHKAQNPNPRSHMSTPDLFRPNFEAVEAGPLRLRAAFVRDGKIAIPTITNVVWDKKADVAFFWMQNEGMANEPAEFFENVPLVRDIPTIGARVGIIAYADMEAESDGPKAEFRSFALKRRLMLRVGRVTAYHPEGHLLCRGPCIETSIPVFPGMSGGLAFEIPEPGGTIRAFGVLSGDPEATIDQKRHRWKAGASIVALLPVDEIVDLESGKQQVALRLENIGIGKDPKSLEAVAERSKFRFPEITDHRAGEFRRANSITNTTAGGTPSSRPI